MAQNPTSETQAMDPKEDKPKPKAPPLRADRGARPLKLVEALNQGKRAVDIVLTRQGSPWNFYKAIYKLSLGQNEHVLVCERREVCCDLVGIRTFRALTSSQIEMLKTVQHQNFITIHELFLGSEESHLTFEHIPGTLKEAVGNPYIDSDKLAAIIGQIVTALSYLEQKGLQHGHLTCSNIYLHHSGLIKLGGQENCAASNASKDIRDLGYVMMELMQGYIKQGKNIGLSEPNRWHPDALNFLSHTESSTSANDLLKHRFLRSIVPRRLKGLASFVMAWTGPDVEFVG